MKLAAIGIEGSFQLMQSIQCRVLFSDCVACSVLVFFEIEIFDARIKDVDVRPECFKCVLCQLTRFIPHATPIKKAVTLYFAK